MDHCCDFAATICSSAEARAIQDRKHLWYSSGLSGAIICGLHYTYTLFNLSMQIISELVDILCKDGVDVQCMQCKSWISLSQIR